MASTLLLDGSTWDFVVDVNANMAVATEPYSLAQDAASAIQTYLGECYYDTTLGVPYLTQIFGFNPTLAYLKGQFVLAALSVDDVGAAQVYISAITDRGIAGQVQVVSASTGQKSAASFSAISPFGNA